MAGKAAIRCTPRLYRGLDKLSKNALIDVIVDRAIAQVGEDRATDEMLANEIQSWLDPVLRLRGDLRIQLRVEIGTYDKQQDLIRQAHETERTNS